MDKILTHHPKEYLEQGLIQCSAYSVKAILSAYGKDVKKHPREYQPTLLAKYTSVTTRIRLAEILQTYGVPAKKGDVKNLFDAQRIELLRKFIDEDKVVALRIGNGYSKSGRYSPFVASFMGHWITLWGYNDEKQIFYVYDSYVSLERHDKTIPVGNTTRTYAEILRDWGKGFPFVWRYTFIVAG